MNNLEYLPYDPSIENKQVNYIGINSKSQNNPYSNTYNAGWRNHLNFSWGGQENQRPQSSPGFQQLYQQKNKLNLKEMLTKFILVLETSFQNTETACKNQKASIQGLENQTGQLAKLISERPQGSLPRNTETNPWEQLYAISIRDEEALVEFELEPR